MKKSLFILSLFMVATLFVSAIMKVFIFNHEKTKGTILSQETAEKYVGIQHKKLSLSIDNENVEVQFFVIKPALTPQGIGITSPYTLSENKEKPGYSGLTLKEYAENGLYKLVQSGGFLSSWTPPYPLGYVKIGGREYSRPHNSWLTEGTFCTDGKKFEIFKYDEAKTQAFLSCLQAGPVISLEGKDKLLKTRNTGYVTKEKHRQSFLCKSYDGNLIMGIAEEVKLISLVTHITSKEEIGCKDTVLLTSKGIAGIYKNYQANPEVIGNADVPLPNAIVVK